MHSTTLISAFVTLAATAVAQDTPNADKSPSGVVYNATVESVSGSNTKGFFSLTGTKSGEAELLFSFTGISNKNNPPYHYRIHENPVSGNDCASAGPIFDPYGIGGTPCQSLPKWGNGIEDTCLAGDVSGRADPIDVPSDKNDNGGFPDDKVSLDPKSKAFVGNRAVVISNGKNEIVACGNLKCVKGDCEVANNPPSNGTSTGSPASGTNSTNGTVQPGQPGSGPAESTNAGSQLYAGAGALFIAVAAALL
ncbi:unnamed protein product [Periconia digitata]|uniref:Superoxide dismutase copper/zinc binding domain-containing protein n=1 Tax=Periconia digitata TaxID=1303443 RepID=A0A9W4UD60_9PLEO|nr:unnamed protein product [Periconia digitata]